MPTYKVIKGVYRVKNYSPDGDSIRFEADEASHWDFFEWRSERKRVSRRKQLRIEAVDALETHYQGYSQPGAFAVAALERLLGLLGIRNVEFSLSVTRIIKADDQTPGFIVSAGLDAFDRPICFAFPDVTALTALTDGDDIEVDHIPLDKSINYRLTRDGLVYPTFYSGMEDTIINKFRRAIKRARRDSRGVWAVDRTNDFTLWNTRTVQEDIVIMPKLFRRLVAFFVRRASFEDFPQ